MKLQIPSIALLMFIIGGCKKEKEQPAPVSIECSSILPNKLSAKIGTQSWCADQTCFGDLAIIMTINGLNGNASNLTLELDDFTPGTYPINQDRNHIVYIGFDGYESTDDNPGTLVIQSNDTSTNLIKGTFNVTLKSAISGNLSASDGKFSVYYTE